MNELLASNEGASKTHRGKETKPHFLISVRATSAAKRSEANNSPVGIAQ